MANVRALLLCLFLADGLPGRPAASRNKGRNPYIDFREVKVCPFKTAMSWMNVTATLGGNGRQIFNGITLFDSTATTWTEMGVRFTKCLGGVSANNCEYQSTWVRKKNVCAEFASPLAPWYPILTSIQPPFLCPTKAGTYRLSNFSLDSAPFVALAGSQLNPDVTWLVRAEVKDQDRKSYMCLDLMARLITAGRKRP